MSKTKSIAAWVENAVKSFTAKKDGPEEPWIKHVALLTGVLAAFAGFLTVRSTSLTNDAIYQSNEAILAQAQASDAWAEYQADSIKARVVETEMVPSSPFGAEDKAALAKADDDLRARQPKSRDAALAAMQKRDAHLGEGRARLGERNLLNYASLASQLGIALASVAAMTRKRIAFYIAILVGVASLAITGYAYLQNGVG
jgi:hypothetical protein